MQEQTTLRVEMVIRGQYVIEGLLGRSNSGATYLVRDQHSRDVLSSLFVLKEVVEANKQARHRLVSAGKLLRRLHHPGLPRVHRVFKDDKNNRVYLLMDYIAGQDLEILRLHQHEKLFSWAEVMSIMAPVIAAVTYLHRQQPPIIHGDIKPANIIMSKEDSEIVLVDFGMMKAYNPVSTTAADQYCYRAPVQSNGIIDVQTDIYALGATFYTLVTGNLPPDAHSRLTRVGNRAMDPLEPVNSVVPAIPMHIGKAIERAMSLNSQHRFSSVEQFWEGVWLVLAEHPAPVFDRPSVPQGPPIDPASGLGQAVGQTIEKPVPEPLLAGSVQESIEEREDLDSEQPPPVVRLPRSVKEREDPDATVRLPKLPPVVPMPESVEEQEDLDVEQQPPVVPASVREQEDLDAEQSLSKLPPVAPVLESIEEPENPDSEKLLSEAPVLDTIEEQEHLDAEKPPPVVPVPESVEVSEDPDASVRLPKLPPVVRIPRRTEEPKDLDSEKTLPNPPGDGRASISLRKLGVLLIGLALLLSLGIGASFLSHARSQPAASTATPTSHAASSASTPTSAPVASSYSTLVALYNGTIYDISANIITKMSLTGIQQTQMTIGGNFTGLNRTGTFNGIIDPHPPKHIQFMVKDSAGHSILSFDGHLQSDGELSGSYCSVDQSAQCTGEYGLWSVAPAS